MSIDIDDIERRMDGALALSKPIWPVCAPGVPAPDCWSRLWSTHMGK